MECGIYHSTATTLKKLHDGTSSDIKNISAKVTKILPKVAHENMVFMTPVCNKSVSIMTELCEFSFIPFGGTEVVNFLDKLLILMSEESYFTCFPGTGNVTASDITDAIAYLHGKDIVHKDNKASKYISV